MKQYNDLVETVLEDGVLTDDRTGVGTLSTFGAMFKFDHSSGKFPAVTTKKLAWKAVVSELIWFLRGSSNVNDLREILHGPDSDKKTIWDANYEDANKRSPQQFFNGSLGAIYPIQWRSWLNRWEDDEIDQLQNAINLINNDPNSRRIMVNSWAVHELDNMALPPCHYNYQFSVKDGKLHLAWNQRSADLFLGIPFNIASYSLLLHIIARITGYEVGNLIGFIGDLHLYNNSIDAAKEVLSRDVKELPTLWINPKLKTLEDFENSTVDDYKLVNYQHHDSIKVEMAV